MPLPDVHISRLNGQLGRVKPTIDNVFIFVVSGVATAGIALGAPALITGMASLAGLQIINTGEGTAAPVATVTITNKGADGNVITISKGVTVIATYTKLVGDATEAAVAAKIALAVGNGYTATSAGAIVTITGTLAQGASINGDVLTVAAGGTMTATNTAFAGGETEVLNALAYDTIKKFYARVKEGTECYLCLFANTTMLEDMCDKNTGIVSPALDYADGRIRGLFVGKTFPDDYTPDIVNNLDSDVIAARAKLQALCVERQAANDPIFAVLPGYGFDSDDVAELLDLGQGNTDYVSILLGADTSAGNAAIGTLAGHLAANEVQRNAGRVASGSVLDEAWLIDGVTAKDSKPIWGILHDKRYIFFRKIFQKSGFFFTDDPAATSITSDYSSLSWNRVMNKVQVISYGRLVEHLNDDVELSENTGKVSPALIANWEGDVENAVKTLMVNTGEISGVKCTIDPESDIINDEIAANISILRKGQAKNINVTIGFVPSL